MDEIKVQDGFLDLNIQLLKNTKKSVKQCQKRIRYRSSRTLAETFNLAL